jgi:hypothetical protein
MKSMLHTAAAAAAAACALAGCSANARQARATVMYIDRDCDIVETTYDANYRPTGSHTYRDACNSVDEWDKVRAKRNKLVSGTAVVHVSYTAPQTGQPQTAELKFDGGDDDFYSLKAGDEIPILVSNSDPTKIAKA